LSYQQHHEELADLESIPAAAFIGDSATSQELCDLIIALALIYNDLRDTHTAHMLLSEVEPTQPASKTAECGQFHGLLLHVMRLQAGLVDELLNVIRKRESVLQEQTFSRVVSQLGKDAKLRWAAIVDVALGKKTGDQTAKKLAIIRNKIAFHYDTEEIGRGFRESFVGKGDRGRAPLLSRGGSLAGTRFYFADAAAQSCILPQGERSLNGDFFEGGGLVGDVNVALYNIVTRFVQVRGYAWRRMHSSIEA
jgi:hypothetical protein